MRQVKENQSLLSQQFDKVNEKMLEIESNLLNMRKKEEKLEALVHDLGVTIRSQQQKIVEMEDRGRRNNLLVFGISETDSETSVELKKKVLDDVFHERLGVRVNTVERIHRLGKRGVDKVRPVIVRFFDYNEKMNLFRNSKKLKGSNTSLSHDYSQATLHKRKKLWASAQHEKDNGADSARA
ncbi:uncharacterized protein LOC144112345 [Amblyomma americanum]